MSELNKISIRVGEFEFESEGSQLEVDEKFAQFKEEGFWNIITERLDEAKDIAIDNSNSAAQEKSFSERGIKFRTLVENCSLEGKPDQVLGALHFLRDIEGLDDCPPRVINALFEQANIEPPGNLSLYINRLLEKNLLTIAKKHDDKNRFAELTEAGRKHLEKKAEN
tara:strand:+ start:2097 stop:2597 length:501 start_codon:yes stop_codon:yes gene_type:complete